MNARSDAFTRGDADCDAEHGKEKYGDGKGDLVNGYVASHLHAVAANVQIDAGRVEVPKHELELLLHPKKMHQVIIR